MEENTSKAYVGPAAGLLLSGQLAAANGTGSALFVINLCASMAPVPLAGKTLPGLDNYRLYQVSRVEDGRTRYRLRLGFFPSEADAEGVLASVRERYPTAFCACLGDEDRKFARGYLPDSASLSDTQIQKRTVSLVPNAPRPVAAPSPAPVAAQRAALPTAPAKPQAVAKPAAAPPAAKAAAAPAPTPVTKVAAPAPIAVATKPAAPVSAPKVAPVAKAAAPVADDNEIEISWEPEAPAQKPAQAAAAPVAAPAAKSPAQPAAKSPVASVEVAADEIEISWEPPSLPAAPANRSQPSASAPVTIAPVFTTDTVIKAKQEVKAPAAAKPAATPAAPVAAAKPVPTAAKPAAPVELTLAAESHPAPRKEATDTKPSATAFHVGKGVEIPAVSLSFAESQAPAAAAKPASPPQPAVEAPAKKAAAVTKAPAKPVIVASKESPKREPLAAIGKPVAAPPVTPAVASAPPIRRPISLPPGIAASASAPELDSTQTIRALTNDELSDAAQEKWFAIQLAVSEQPVNLDAMPHLDIFEAYRLYSVASAGSGKIVHSLRLGFFREAVSADAVGGYLKTFFPNPSVVRISIAEQLRFKDAPAPRPAKADPKADAKADTKVIDLSDARQRAAKPVVPTVTMEVATPRQGATADRSPTGAHKLSATGTFKLNATGAHKLDATGAHKLDATGAHKLTATGTHKINSSGPHKLSTTGVHKALKTAAKQGGPASRHSAASKSSKSSATGKFRAVGKKSLTDQLLDEAREVELSESGIRKLPKSDSLLARLVDKLKN